jgi:hypothetical protein
VRERGRPVRRIGGADLADLPYLVAKLERVALAEMMPRALAAWTGGQDHRRATLIVDVAATAADSAADYMCLDSLVKCYLLAVRHAPDGPWTVNPPRMPSRT